MKKAFLVIISLVFASLTFSFWQEDFQTASDQAKSQNKNIFIYFTGSDFCPWCKKFASEILDTPQFQEATAKYFEFLYVDFPAKKPISEKQYIHNQSLKEKYAIPGVPEVVIVDPDGMVIAKIGYLPIGSERYAKKVVEIIDQYNDLKKKDMAILSPLDLKSAYEKAKSLGNDQIKEKALNEGMKKDGKLYFLFEKYICLIEEQKVSEAEDIRKQIVQIDPNNIQKSYYRLALIDFEALTKAKNTVDPKEAIKPLIEYINEFGKKDKDNMWRMEMIISQFLGSHGLFKEALGHARASCKAAPVIIRKELVQTILYLKRKIQEEE